MRKITFLFYALLFCCFGAAAQPEVASLDELSNEKVYAIRSARDVSGKYLFSNSDIGYLCSNYGGDYSTKEYNTENTEFQFVLYKVSTEDLPEEGKIKAKGSYYIYSIGAGMFIGTPQYGSENLVAIPMTKYITNTIEIRELTGEGKNQCRFLLSTDKQTALNAVGNQAAGNYGAANWDKKNDKSSAYDNALDDAGNLYSFVEIGEIPEDIKTHIENAISNRSTVTINYKIGEEIYKTEKRLYGNGTELSLSAVATNAPDYVVEDYKTIDGIKYNGETADNIVIKKDITIDITYKEVLPFVKSENPDDNATWYVVNIHDNNKYWKYDGNNDNNVQTPKLTTLAKNKIAEEYLWCFVGNVFDGFKIYNKATNNTLCKIGDYFKLDDSDANNLYELKYSTTNSGATCFASMSETGTYKYINPQGNTLKGWNAADAGSSCTFIIPEVYVADAYLAQSAAPENAVGFNSAVTEKFDDLETVTGAVKTAPNNAGEIEKLFGLLSDIEKGNVNELVSGGYYRIINADPRFKEKDKTVGFLYDPTNSTSSMRWGVIKNDNVDAIVQIEKTDNGYFIKHCNKEQYMQSVTGTFDENKQTNGVTFFELGGAQFNVVFSNETCHANGHSNGNGNNGNLINYPGEINTPSAWYIVPATDIEVSMNYDGEGKYWASTYLPFAVSTEDATILIGKEVVGFYLTLEEEKTLPAKTGAILYMERDENNADESSTVYCTLNIVDNSDAAATNTTEPSRLEGTLTEQPMNGDWKNYFVLSKGSNGVGLYYPYGETLKANKAYLYDENGDFLVNGLRFSFGEVTGIDNAAAERNADTGSVYDLSGRRVAAPVSGIYVKDGKKIFVR